MLMDSKTELQRTFKRLAEKLNKLMKHKLIVDLDDKPIPYLGWAWRDISPSHPKLTLSKTEGHWWIDEATKWDYPIKEVDTPTSIEILKHAIKIVGSYIKLIQLLTDKEEGQ